MTSVTSLLTVDFIWHFSYHVSMKQGYICWVLNEEDRTRLLATFPPEFENVVAHHVTHAYDVPENTPLPCATLGTVVGEIIDNGVQAFVVEVNGNTIRPDGFRYHITWSLAPERVPQQSVPLTTRGWWPLVERQTVRLEPQWIELTPKEVV